MLKAQFPEQGQSQHKADASTAPLGLWRELLGHLGAAGCSERAPKAFCITGEEAMEPSAQVLCQDWP